MCTTPFVPLAQVEAQALRVPDLPIVVIDHPLGGEKSPAVRERAERAFAAFVEAVYAAQPRELARPS